MLVGPQLFGVVRVGGKVAAAQDPVAVPNIDPTPIGLPSFDARLGSAGEIMSLNLAEAGNDPVVASRLDAIEQFRAQLEPAASDGLVFELNNAKVPKMFFSHAGALSPPSSDTPDQIARDFLARNRRIFALESDYRHLKLGNEDNDAGTTFLNYEQLLEGVTVFHGHVQVVVNSQGQVISVNEGWLLDGYKVMAKPKLKETRAIRKAFEYAGKTIPGNPVLIEGRDEIGGRATFANPIGPDYENIISDLRVLEVEEEARLAWHIYLDVAPGEWYEILLDAKNGELLYRGNLYNDAAQGTVYTQNPGVAGRQLVSFVGDTTINTAAGWMGTSTVTTGNNVEAYLDSDANNTPDNVNTAGLSVGHASAANQDFTFPFQTGVDPRTQRAAVVTNLFYFNNIMHDFVYGLGFTESAGNFQVNNFGRGGTGNDSVRAEAQDGSGTNNANFATPPEGSRPRMQQFIFTQGTSSLADDRDSSNDGDVVLHEYGHGVSNRLVGGPQNVSCLGGTQAGAMGEAWSDYWAITFFNDGRVGEYVTNNATSGIRRAAYTVPANPIHDSYADLGVGGFQVHRDGEVWAATLWDLRTQLGATITDRLIIQGMKFTPCGPSFLNARDAIIQADQNLNGGANRCTIWTVFARHGMGVSAVGNNGTTHVAATDLPSECTGGGGTTVFFDNFETSLGWVTNPNGNDTATTGQWQRANPETTTSSGTKQVGTTVSGVNDLVTGALAGASAGVNDVDGGTTSIISPNITLPSTGTLTLSFSFYLAHGSNATSADFLRVSIVSGSTTTQVFQRLGAANDVDGVFSSTSVNLSAFAGQTVRILIQAADAATASLVEAGVDDVRITRQ
jgi:Zn-dependent metalloprotease